nr:MAG TPA: hypothetical protein [Caudoviricetes sp.]
MVRAGLFSYITASFRCGFIFYRTYLWLIFYMAIPLHNKRDNAEKTTMFPAHE